MAAAAPTQNTFAMDALVGPAGMPDGAPSFWHEVTQAGASIATAASRRMHKRISKAFVRLSFEAQSMWRKLRNTPLRPVPEYVTDISQIEHYFAPDGHTLNLSSLSIKHIEPIVFEQIAHKNSWLEMLNLSDNQLTKIPENIDILKKLHRFYAYHNHLTKLPDSIVRLKHLNLIYLGENDLHELPMTIGNLLNLQYLDVAHNKLQKLPSLRRLTKLYSINLACNLLKNFSTDLFFLPSLQHICIGDNPCVFRSDWLQTKRGFQPTTFLFDYIPPAGDTTLPEHISDIGQIVTRYHHEAWFGDELGAHTLSLHTSSIKSIDPIVFEQIADFWPDIKVIDLSYTPLAAASDLPEDLLTGLRILCAHGIFLNKVILNTRERGNLTIPMHIFHSEQIMSKYHVISGKFGDIDGGVFELPSHCINSFHPIVFTLIAHNEKAAGTQALFLMDNPLRTLPATVAQLAHLRVINLDDTLVQELPIEIFLMPSLHKISLTNTPLGDSEEFAALCQDVRKRRAALGLEPLIIETEADGAAWVTAEAGPAAAEAVGDDPMDVPDAVGVGESKSGDV